MQVHDDLYCRGKQDKDVIQKHEEIGKGQVMNKQHELGQEKLENSNLLQAW